MRTRTIVLYSTLAVAVVGAGGLAYAAIGSSGGSSTKTATRLVSATVGTVSQTVTATGTVQPAASYDLNFTNGGVLTAVKVKAGDKVTAGQVLATIDSAKAEVGLESAQAARGAAQQKLDQAKTPLTASQQAQAAASLAQAQAQLDAARQQLAGAIDPADVAKAQTAMNQAQANLDSVKAANDVVRVRNKLGLPQIKFARLLGISEDTLQNWEQGRRKPAGPAKVLLKIAAKHPKIVFVNSMSDMFHARVPREFILRAFDVMQRADWHRFQVLTKRADRLTALNEDLPWADNIWMGVSVENESYTYRIDHLRNTSAAIKFLSLEPLLGPLDNLGLDGIDWVIVGGESGPGARRMDSEWVISIRDQCVDAHVPFFFKQWGGVRKKRFGRTLEGQTWDQMPTANRLESAVV